MQSFQGGVPEVYKEECPLAGILSAVYGVSHAINIITTAAVLYSKLTETTQSGSL